MIKEGQIYKEKDEIFAITYATSTGNYHAVKTDGKVFSGFGLSQSDLISEYPTWQEAVNSKEFKNGYKTDREIELEKNHSKDKGD